MQSAAEYSFFVALNPALRLQPTTDGLDSKLCVVNSALLAQFIAIAVIPDGVYGILYPVLDFICYLDLGYSRCSCFLGQTGLATRWFHQVKFGRLFPVHCGFYGGDWHYASPLTAFTI